MVWYMRGVAHVHPGAFSVRAPPFNASAVCNVTADVNPDTVWRHIATLSDCRPFFEAGLPCAVIISTACIRAPPTPSFHS